MRRYLLVALWPAGIAAIAAATAVAARRASTHPGPASRHFPARATQPAGSHQQTEHNGAGTEAVGIAAHREARSPSDTSTVPKSFSRPSHPGARPEWVPDLLRLSAISCADGALAYGVMVLLGRTVVNRGPTIDEPIVRWITSNQVRPWAAVMVRLDKVGHTWTTWSAAGTAAACLGMGWRSKRWLPPTVLGAAVLVDKYVTLALRRTFGRPGPPGSPGGTYPSGGCDRVVLFYGLIADMLWREYSGSRRGRTVAVGAVAALAFNQAYSRLYLSKHWFTDIVTGTLYGALLLVPFVAAVESVAGPVDPIDRPHDTADVRAADLPPSAATIKPHRRWIPLSAQRAGLARWLRAS